MMKKIALLGFLLITTVSWAKETQSTTVGNASVNYQSKETVVSVTECVPAHDITCSMVFQELNTSNISVGEDYYFSVTQCPSDGHFKSNFSVHCDSGNLGKIMFIGCIDSTVRSSLDNKSLKAIQVSCG